MSDDTNYVNSARKPTGLNNYFIFIIGKLLDKDQLKVILQECVEDTTMMFNVKSVEKLNALKHDYQC
jgi:hypothetical protein